MSNINAIFAGMTGHPTHAASSLSFHVVHLGPNASNWWTTFLFPTHGLVSHDVFWEWLTRIYPCRCLMSSFSKQGCQPVIGCFHNSCDRESSSTLIHVVLWLYQVTCHVAPSSTIIMRLSPLFFDPNINKIALILDISSNLVFISYLLYLVCF